MNFQNGGLIVWMLNTQYGESWFWGSCGVCLVLCFVLFEQKGWMDMLGSVRRGGQHMAQQRLKEVGVTLSNFVKRKANAVGMRESEGG